MLDIESFKETVTFQAYNALQAAKQHAQDQADIGALRAECQRLSALVQQRDGELLAARSERDAAQAKLADVAEASAHAAARVLLDLTQKPEPGVADSDGGEA